MTVLTCLVDLCPRTGKPVDMRLCCGGCPHYRKAPWSEFGKVTCGHPKAAKAPEPVREANRLAFRETAKFGGHLLYAGPLRGDVGD